MQLKIMFLFFFRINLYIRDGGGQVLAVKSADTGLKYDRLIGCKPCMCAWTLAGLGSTRNHFLTDGEC